MNLPYLYFYRKALRYGTYDDRYAFQNIKIKGEYYTEES